MLSHPTSVSMSVGSIFCIDQLNLFNLHCLKSVRIRSFSGRYFSAFGLNAERHSISQYSVRMRKNMDQKNSEYGHFSHSVKLSYWVYVEEIRLVSNVDPENFLEAILSGEFQEFGLKHFSRQKKIPVTVREQHLILS